MCPTSWPPFFDRRSTFQSSAIFDVFTPSERHKVLAGSYHVFATMSLAHETEKNHYGDPPPVHYSLGDHAKGHQLSANDEDVAIVISDQNELRKDLKGRHMQMIAMSVSPNTP